MEKPYQNPYKSPFQKEPTGDPALKSGRLVVIGVIVVIMGFSVATILMTNLMAGNQKLMTQAIRFLLTVGLCVGLYNGQTWARYLMVFLFGVASVVALVSLPQLLSVNAHPLIVAYLVAMMVGYAGSAIALIAVPSVNKFLEHQRSRSTIPLDSTSIGSGTKRKSL